MVKLTRLNRQLLVVNAAHILLIEASPDTLLTLTTGEKIRVREELDEVIEKVVRYLRRVGGKSALAPVLVREKEEA